MKTLIIAEKPSVGRAIAQALGVSGRKDGYIEDDRYSVSWCFGHLVELADATAYDEKYKAWDLADIPIIPGDFRYAPRKDAKAQLAVLTRLMNRPDIDCVMNACDAGREGELIFRLVYTEAGCDKPTKRLWVSSMEPDALRDGVENAAPGEDYDSLYASALCRQQADWIVGINATRLFTKLDGVLRRVGRVVTPTLRLLYDRALEIENFKSEPYWHVRLDLKGGTASSERITDKAQADDLAARCRQDTAVCESVETQKKTSAPPKLFDLTALQREANKLFGFTARHTLELAQSLYEHRYLTYPRTDSRFLTDDMEGAALAAGTAAAALLSLPVPGELNAKRVLNSKKVSDHHAIIPTGTQPDIASLSDDERALYTLCAARLVCAMLPAMEYEATTAVFSCAGVTFTAKGRRILSPGWKEAEDAYLVSVKNRKTKDDTEDADEDNAGTLPQYAQGETFENPEATVTDHMTKPPAQYTEASLLAAMERAGAAETTDEAERKGLGTPATRAGIIEKLVSDKCVSRKGKTLRIEQEGRDLIETLPEVLKSPATTSEWENELVLIAKGEHLASDFMSRIRDLTRQVIADNKSRPVRMRTKDRGEPLGKCPRCGGNVYDGKKSYFCENWKQCGFSMFKENRFFAAKKLKFTPAIAKALLKDGKSHQKKLWSESKQKYYEADILLADDGGQFVNFGLDFGPKRKAGGK